MWLQRRKDKKLAMGVAVAMGMGTEGLFSSVTGLPAQAEADGGRALQREKLGKGKGRRKSWCPVSPEHHWVGSGVQGGMAEFLEGALAHWKCNEEPRARLAHAVQPPVETLGQPRWPLCACRARPIPASQAHTPPGLQRAFQL